MHQIDINHSQPFCFMFICFNIEILKLVVYHRQKTYNMRESREIANAPGK